MTCQEAIAVLADYLEDELGPSLLTAFEQHLSTCAPCVAYLNTYRQTRALGAAASRVEMPAEMRGRLRQLLLDQLSQDTPPGRS
jgi:anti-sigma factor RsiW